MDDPEKHPFACLRATSLPNRAITVAPDMAPSGDDAHVAAARPDRQPVWRAALMPSVASLLLVGAALAGAADDLVREIERTIDDITIQIHAQPEQALAELGEQERQLDVLFEIEPRHPAIAGLRQRLAALEARLSDARTAAITAPPADVDRTLEQLRTRFRQAETAWLSKDNARASGIAREVRLSLDGLLRKRGGEIPGGYVALFVLEERLIALERELNGVDGH